MLPETLAQFSAGGVVICTSGFVDDVTFSHNGTMARRFNYGDNEFFIRDCCFSLAYPVNIIE